MEIIVDSGATKAEWCVLDRGTVRDRFCTPGINWTTASQGSTDDVLARAAARIGGERAGRLHFFGAGMTDGDTAPLEKFFPAAEIECASDLLAAARAVCGREAGIVAILGTGSNTGLYDGARITAHVHPCGYILGDEGGAACLGKRFLGEFLKGRIPEPVAAAFAAAYPSDYATVVREVYRSAAPARYLGSFAPWILGWYGKDGRMTELIEENLRDFIRIFLRRYDTDRHAVGVVGSFGAACRPILEKVGEGIRFSRFLPRPMDGLIRYYGGCSADPAPLHRSSSLGEGFGEIS